MHAGSYKGSVKQTYYFLIVLAFFRCNSTLIDALDKSAVTITRDYPFSMDLDKRAFIFLDYAIDIDN
ncbi:hypothetical protein [Paenibacillus assamensis]|uniref:hypothetical protein n=1 Tax=Paenibacillus assamensis TaxID=311244 RepID=UPI000426ECC0|nr:hypothetical protein [Paenibacillus assamensis]